MSAETLQPPVCEEDNLRYQDLGNLKMKSRCHESAKTPEWQTPLLTLGSDMEIAQLHSFLESTYLAVNMTKF